MRASTATASGTELDAYGSILGTLRILAQDLQSVDLRQSQVTETIRTHLLQMRDSLEAGREEMPAGCA